MQTNAGLMLYPALLISHEIAVDQPFNKSKFKSDVS